MPEGPEVETVRRSLAPKLLGETLGLPFTSGSALRQHVPQRRVLHRALASPVDAVSRRGKVLFIQAGPSGCAVRLGMSGRIEVVAGDEKRPRHTHVVWPIGETGRVLRYVDPRRFGDVRPYLDEAEREALATGIGAEPETLSRAGVRRAVIERAQRSSAALKVLLLDQARVAGLGNIYVCEILFRTGDSPFARGCDLSTERWHALLKMSRRVFNEAVRHRGTSFADYVDADGNKGAFQHRLKVFQKDGAPCPGCAAPIRRATQHGRSTFYCPTCQPGPPAPRVR